MGTPHRLVLVALAGLWALTGPAAAQKPGEEELADQVRVARERGAAFLKDKQRHGNWERDGPPGANFPGAMTSLVVLALLDTGAKPDDKEIAEGLAYLRTVPPDKTYAVSLQTLAFCRTGQPKDRERIQRNADWLRESMRRDLGGRWLGWSYGKSVSAITDGSNTQYAVLALHAASRAGARIEARTWGDLRDFYLRTQHADGGWSYRPEPEPSTPTMTCAGICGLLITAQELSLKDEEAARGLAKGLEYLTTRFDPANDSLRYASCYDLLFDFGQVRQLPGKDLFTEKQRDLVRACTRIGVKFLLKGQEQDGSWKGDKAWGKEPIISTSMALLFLSRTK
jgi:hypothetical protein